jgi:hypothetical protein
MCLRSDSLHKVIERLANPGWLVFLCLDETFSFNFLVDVTISDRVADRIVQGYLLSTFVCIFQYFVTPNLHWIWRVENFSDIFWLYFEDCHAENCAVKYWIQVWGGLLSWKQAASV